MQNLFLPHHRHNSNPRPLLWAPMQEFFLLIVRRIWAHRQYLSMLEAKEQTQEAIRPTGKSQINLDHQDSQICHLVLTNRSLYLRRLSSLLQELAGFSRQADNPSAFDTLHGHRIPACRPQVAKERRLLFLRINTADKVDLGELNIIQWNLPCFVLCFWNMFFLYLEVKIRIRLCKTMTKALKSWRCCASV
jgi:hypothetical protein